MEKTIYKYRDMIENELLISQGDIFCNLPYLTYDQLIQSGPDIINKFQDEKDKIFTSILRNGGKIQVEGFLDAHWGILASQDCDLLPNKDLIFFPLKETITLFETDNIVKAIDENIKDTTRSLYLPRIAPPNTTKTYGPFEIIFHNPFNVPFNLIHDNLDYCWKARIIEEARKVFIGKLSHFYSRIPIEEIIFLENKEISKYFIKGWSNFWEKKKDPVERFQNRINRINQAKDILKLVNREYDLQNIFYFDLELIKNIKKFLEFIDWFENAKELLNKCKEVELKFNDVPTLANNCFKEIISNFFIKEHSLLSRWKKYYNTSEEKIREIRRENVKILGIFPDNILESENDYRAMANKAFNATKLYEKFPSYLKGYSDIF